MSESNPGFSKEERDAAKARAAELRADAKRSKLADKAAEEAKENAAAIAGLDGLDRELAERIAAIVAAEAPELAPKTWYGMPTWARDGKAAVFFKPAAKFKSRYATLGFEQGALLDDGLMWATDRALLGIDDAVAAEIAALVRRAAGHSS